MRHRAALIRTGTGLRPAPGGPVQREQDALTCLARLGTGAPDARRDRLVHHLLRKITGGAPVIRVGPARLERDRDIGRIDLTGLHAIAGGESVGGQG
ncbi:hypothetical protein FLP41_11065 [Paracoccus marcusii]|nr:hypothetical protein FLP41_11065 [Paracoccus marcusii]